MTPPPHPTQSGIFPPKSENLGFPPPLKAQKERGRGHKIEGFLPIPESEEPVTVETNPSPPNKNKEGDKDQDTMPKEAGTLRNKQVEPETRRTESQTLRQSERLLRAGPESHCHREPQKFRDSPQRGDRQTASKRRGNN